MASVLPITTCVCNFHRKTSSIPDNNSFLMLKSAFSKSFYNEIILKLMKVNVRNFNKYEQICDIAIVTIPNCILPSFDNSIEHVFKNCPKSTIE